MSSGTDSYHENKLLDQYFSAVSLKEALDDLSDHFSRFSNYIENLTDQNKFVMRYLWSYLERSKHIKNENIVDKLANLAIESPLVRLKRDQDFADRVSELPIFLDKESEELSPRVKLCCDIITLVEEHGVGKVPSNFSVDHDKRWGESVDGFENEAVHIVYLLMVAIDKQLDVRQVRSALETRRANNRLSKATTSCS